MFCKRHAELQQHVWERQRLRQLLRTAGPLRRPSVHPDHASALLPYRELLSSVPFPLFWDHGLSFPRGLLLPLILVVVKLDRPFSPESQIINTPLSLTHTEKLLSSQCFDPLFTFGLIWIPFASDLHGSWSFSCVSFGSLHANLLGSFSMTCLSFGHELVWVPFSACSA